MAGSEQEEIRPLGQKIMDNIFLLLTIGLAFPSVFYFAWGMLEIFVFNDQQLSDYVRTSGILSGGK